MDIEQFRRAYMHAEGMMNTPANLVTRLANLAKCTVGMVTAIGKDRAEWHVKKEYLKFAWRDMRKNGLNAKNLKEAFQNRPTYTHTAKATDRLASAALDVSKSLNELGSTGRVSDYVVASHRSNLYNGQDLEKGVDFLTKAMNAALKGLRISSSLKNSINLGIVKGLDIVEHKSSVDKEARAFDLGKHSKEIEFDR